MKRDKMIAYLKGELALKNIDDDECLDIAYQLLEAALPLVNKGIRHEPNEYINLIYQSCRDEIEAAMEGIS